MKTKMTVLLFWLLALSMVGSASQPDLTKIAYSLGWDKGVKIAEIPNQRGAWNAYATPQGVFVTPFMYRDNDFELDEWAFIMAHEISHEELGHTLESPAKRILDKRTIFGALVGYAVSGKDGIADGALWGFQLAVMHYSRKNETSADERAVKLVSAAGYDPLAGASCFQKMTNRFGGGGKTPVIHWLSTHPASKDRQGRIKKWASDWQPVTNEFSTVGATGELTFAQPTRSQYKVGDLIVAKEDKHEVGFARVQAISDTPDRKRVRVELTRVMSQKNLFKEEFYWFPLWFPTKR